MTIAKLGVNTKSYVKMTKREMEEIARGGIERGVEFGEGASPDHIYDDCYTAAFDHLVDKGVSPETAGRVADKEARKYAQP